MCIDHTEITNPPTVTAATSGNPPPPSPPIYEFNPTTGIGCSVVQGTLSLDSGTKYYRNDCNSNCQRCEMISTSDGNMFIELRCRVCKYSQYLNFPLNFYNNASNFRLSNNYTYQTLSLNPPISPIY
jgi:hypothetical protein